MFDRFTDRARKCMGLAREEAQRFNHDYIGTEHILLGVLKEGRGVAAKTLSALGVDIRRVREEVERLTSTGTTMVTMGQLPFTPRAKKVLMCSLEEASGLGHTYIGTEHLLLGLLRETEGIAAQALRILKVKADDVRAKVLEVLGVEAAAPPGEIRFDRFDDRSRKVLGLAWKEAGRRDHDYIGTEHVLLGILEEGSGVAAKVLQNLDVDLAQLRREVEKLVSPGTTPGAKGQLPFTPRAKRVLELAIEESKTLGHSHVGTEHLLLGLLREGDGIAVHVLREAKVKVEDVREETLEILELGRERKEGGGVRGASAWSAFMRIGPLFTPLCVTALGYAHRLAATRDRSVDPLHLLAGLVILAAEERPQDPALVGLFDRVDLPNLAASASRDAEAAGASPRSEVPHTPETLRILAAAMTRAAEAGRATASEADLLAALVSDPDSPASTWLREHGVDVDRLRRG